MATTKEKEVEQLRKITIKAIMGANPDVEDLLKAEGKQKKLCHIFGVATKAKPGSSDHGPYVAFLGEFRAVNLETKQAFSSNKCILPSFLEEGLFAALPEGGGNVEFAVEIGVKYDKDAATKYIYNAKSLLPTQENAQMAALESRVKEAAKLLEKK